MTVNYHIQYKCHLKKSKQLQNKSGFELWNNGKSVKPYGIAYLLTLDQSGANRMKTSLYIEDFVYLQNWGKVAGTWYWWFGGDTLRLLKNTYISGVLYFADSRYIVLNSIIPKYFPF